MEPEYVEFKNATGLRLVATVWRETVANLQGNVFLVHGLFSHSSFSWLRKPLDSTPETSVTEAAEVGCDSAYVPRYEGSWIEQLCQQGYRCIGLDLQGHGLSEGWDGARGNVEYFDHYVDDLALVVKHFTTDVSVPSHAMGSSMGAAILLRLVQRQEADIPPFTNLVLLGPMTDIMKPWWYGLVKPALSGLSRFRPHFKVAGPEKEPTPDPRMNEWVFHDPYYQNDGLSARLVHQLNKAVDALHADIHKIQNVGRITIFHNFNDDICDVNGSMKLYTDLKKHRPEIDDEIVVINGHAGLPREFMRRPGLHQLHVFHVLADVPEVLEEVLTLF